MKNHKCSKMMIVKKTRYFYNIEFKNCDRPAKFKMKQNGRIFYFCGIHARTENISRKKQKCKKMFTPIKEQIK